MLQERAEATELSRTCLFGHAEIRIVLVGGDVRDKAKEFGIMASEKVPQAYAP